MFCLGFLFLNTGCEKSADQTTSRKFASNGQLTNRDTDACEHCTENDCCCGFELLNPGLSTITFRVCGYDDGTTNCTASPPSPCGSVSGGMAQPMLNSGNPKFAFCQLQGTYFQITNVTFGTTVDIRISCHFNYTTITDWTYVTLGYGQTYTWGVDGECAIDQCAP